MWLLGTRFVSVTDQQVHKPVIQCINKYINIKYIKQVLKPVIQLK